MEKEYNRLEDNLKKYSNIEIETAKYMKNPLNLWNFDVFAIKEVVTV